MLQELQDTILEARKTKNPMAAFYVSTFAEVCDIAKRDGNRTPTDADAERAIRASIRQMDSLLLGDAEKGVAPLPECQYRERTQAQRDCLACFVPEPLVGEPLGVAIREAAVFCDTQIEVKSMGKIMARLKEVFPGRINGADVKEMIEKGC